MRDRVITAPADQISGADFMRHVLGDPNDITGCPQAGGYFLRDGAWMLIREHHYCSEGLAPAQSDPFGDPFLEDAA